MQGDYADLREAQDGSTPALARCVCDYIAGMTDRFAAESFARFFMPSSWRGV
jgi:dGTP triphosphohydrolase